MNWKRILFFISSIAFFVVAFVNWSAIMSLLACVAFAFGVRIDLWYKILAYRTRFSKLVVHLVEWIVAVLIAIILLYNISALFLDLYSIPSTSMEPNLKPGDMVIVNKTILGTRLFENHSSSYFRIGGIGRLRRADIIIFNFPEGDSCVIATKADNYLYIRRLQGEGTPSSQLKFVPIASRGLYLKRIIGLPLDTITIHRGDVFVNRIPLDSDFKTLRTFVFDSVKDASIISKLNASKPSYSAKKASVQLAYPFDFKSLGIDSVIVPFAQLAAVPDRLIFPFQISIYHFNCDNIGSVVVPKKGCTIDISSYTIPFYRRIISVYEGNDLKENSDGIFINGKLSKSYTFKQNYYWVMGDNRGHSFDSRYWGFVPENHIVGVASYVVLSDAFKKNVKNELRLERFLMPLR